MVAKELEVGDLVWAKMKGFPPWPGRIESPPESKKAKSAKPQHFVYFFGTNNFAWMPDEVISRHSKKMVENSKTYKKMPAFLQAAIEEIEKEDAKLDRQGGNSADGSISPGPSSPVQSSPEKVEKEKTLPKIKKSATKASATKKQLSPRITPVIGRVPKKRATPKKSVSEDERPLGFKRRLLTADFEAVASNQLDYEEDSSDDEQNDLQENGHGNMTMVTPYLDQGSSRATRILDRQVIPLPKIPTLDISKVSEKLLQKKIIPTTKKIGFLGLGMMGQGMVKNLLNSGHQVTLWNRTMDKCTPFVAAGALQAPTPSDVVAQCDITFCCVADQSVAKELVFGNCGVLKGLCENGALGGNKGYVEMTSVDSETSLEIAEAVSDKGGHYLAAPVLGSRELAEKGELVILGSGDQSLFKACESCFFAMSTMSYFLSCNVAEATQMNLIVSMLHGSVTSCLAEALALAEASEASTTNLMAILKMGPFNHPFFEEKLRSMIDRKFATNTALKHQQKDLELAAQLGESVDQPLTVASMANELFKRAKLMQYAEHDMAAVFMGTKP